MYKRKLAWETLDRKSVEEFCREYLEFLRECKTVRETVRWIAEEAKKRGFVDLSEVDKVKPGDKVYSVFKGKTIILAVVGKEDLEKGINIVAAHADSPHLDLKPISITEDKDVFLAYLKVGYYGGLVFYQWLNRPLELRGYVVRRDGKEVWIKVGGLLIPELAPHLSKQRFEERKGRFIVEGEELRVIAANTRGKDKNAPFKSKVIEILKERYGIEEEDLFFAELCLVPEEDPREGGVDGSFILGYGQDDRVCVYTAVRALFDMKNTPDRTAVVWIVDKEEIGSESNTSAQSVFLKLFIKELARKLGSGADPEKVLAESYAISADVTFGINPGFESVYDKDNAARIGGGVAVEKYLSVAGKYESNDARTEFVSKLVALLDKHKVPWQPSVALSKTDPKIGGGGTIAKFLARHGMDVVDMGVPLLGMHAPVELASKADIYSAYLAYKVFLEEFK